MHFFITYSNSVFKKLVLKASLVVVFASLISCSDDYKYGDQLTNTVSIIFCNNSLTKENTSLNVVLDNNLVLQTDSFYSKGVEPYKILLNLGPHTLTVMDTKGVIKESKSFFLKLSDQPQKLVIASNVSPHKNEMTDPGETASLMQPSSNRYFRIYFPD